MFTISDEWLFKNLWWYKWLTFYYWHNHAIISQFGEDVPFWLQFALVISSIHIEMRLSAATHHSVISTPPNLMRNKHASCRRSYGSHNSDLSHQTQGNVKQVTTIKGSEKPVLVKRTLPNHRAWNNTLPGLGWGMHSVIWVDRMEPFQWDVQMVSS